MTIIKQHWKVIVTILLFGVAVFFSTYKLTESPPTWMDEGIIIQTARAIADTGLSGIPVAPGVYESAGIVSTSYPVTYPIALVFKLFGPGLFQARVVMVVYLLLLFITVFFLLKRFISPKWYLFSFALFVTFAPLYGQGKNVLGEVPGMFFLFVFLITLYYQEKTKGDSAILPVISGLSAGLFVATKPIFILIIPAVVGALLLRWIWLKKSGVLFNHKQIFLFVFLVTLPVFLWFLVQFSGDSISTIFSHYTNPYKVEMGSVIWNNIRLFFSDFQPVYFLSLLGVWVIAFVLRLWKKADIYFSECVALAFSLLVFLAFFRTPGYYRYFFPAQVLALLYLIPSAEFIVSKIKIFTESKKKIIMVGFVCVLFIIHAYGLLFTSWTAKSYSSTRTQNMQEYFSKVKSQNIFLYQVPEVATFLPVGSFYQFFYPAPLVPIGEESLWALSSDALDLVIVNTDNLESFQRQFTTFEKIDTVERYSNLINSKK
ncbi:MAG: hypothetical protein UU06_C0002G0013 [Parcubacteria group bacterium GW2011_GWB1_40_5]|nr:MAG: hypothetical protein UU06_C0002G0013 [Parcubacteria group bacterium GW2011_GWB1_40_5]